MAQRLLLIEENVEDYLALRAIFEPGMDLFKIDWAPNLETARKSFKNEPYVAYVIAYQHSQHSFLRRILKETHTPLLLLIDPNQTLPHWLNTAMHVETLNKAQLNLKVLVDTLHCLQKIVALQQVENKFALAFQYSAELVAIIDTTGCLNEINQAALDFAQLQRHAIIGLPLWNTPWMAGTTVTQEKVRTAVENTLHGQVCHIEVDVFNAQNEGHLFHLHFTPMHDPNNHELNWILMQGQPLTERKQFEQQLAYVRNHDQLTDLPNRAFFIEQLERCLQYAESKVDYKLALLFLDLDRFKLINESLGHDMGDWLLMEITQRLQMYLPKKTLLAHSSGDEFLVLLDGLDDWNDAVNLAQLLLKKINTPFMLDGCEVVTTASIGIAYNLDAGSDNMDLLRDVDAAMYHAKYLGGARYAVFNPAMRKKAQSRLKIQADLHKGIGQQDFVLYYQPQINLHNGRLVSAESLIRFHHPQYGLITPGEFLSELEDTGMILSLGEWILHTACAQFKQWQQLNLGMERIAVNLSAYQFRDSNLVHIVMETLNKLDIAPENLELELTESILLEDIQSALKMLNIFRDLGIRVTVDDFGMGYSSLNYLKQFPTHCLKIDKSFIRGIITDPQDAAITVATIDMAHALGLTVIAEGVETNEQRDFLRDNNCDLVQGYFYAQPMSHDTFISWAQRYSQAITIDKI